MATQFSTPVIIGKGTERRLERLPMGFESESKYNEDWLQDLLFNHLSALPICEIDQSYLRLIPVCRELRTPAGPIDVLYVTPEGKLVVLEAKLWRNPEARRKVIGQILDYAKELGRWTYEDLQREVAQATRNQTGTAINLYSLVASTNPDVPEAQFIDSVSRNLKRGEFLLLIVGDGIHEGVAAIADFLESHGTLHFTFGMVEMAIFRIDDDLLVQPRIIAQTTIIKRTVISLEDERLVACDANEIEKETSSELSDTQKFYQDFWNEFISELKLDDTSQPPPNVTRQGNVFLSMPSKSNAWITIYFSQKDKEVGTFLTFTRGSLADMLYQRLVEDKEAIDAELGITVEWKSDGEGKYTICAKKAFPDLRSSEHRGSIKQYLSDMANRFVNVFRPRIERIMNEDIK
jgi:hypothetical protein